MNNAPKVLSNEGILRPGGEDIGYRLGSRWENCGYRKAISVDLYQAGWKLDGGVCHDC